MRPKEMAGGVLALLLASWTATAGHIDLGAPLVAGDVSTPATAQGIGPAALSADQVRQIGRWLRRHRSGWHAVITPASSEPIRWAITLQHSDGRTTTICIVARANGAEYLRLTGPGVMAYRSLAGFIQTWAATRPLPEAQDETLRALVGAGG